jgi:hypothetical protein
MESYLRWRGIRLFDFPKFAKPYRDAIRDNAEQLARAHGIAVLLAGRKVDGGSRASRSRFQQDDPSDVEPTSFVSGANVAGSGKLPPLSEIRAPAALELGR